MKGRGRPQGSRRLCTVHPPLSRPHNDYENGALRAPGSVLCRGGGWVRLGEDPCGRPRTPPAASSFFISRSHSSTSASAIAGVTFSTNSSLTCSTGAVPHEARHSAVIRVKLPSAVVFPR